MTRRQTELSSPNEMGVPMTRMSAPSTFRHSAGQSSRSKPCSVMSGYTPGGSSWSTARISSVRIPLASMSPELQI